MAGQELGAPSETEPTSENEDITEQITLLSLPNEVLESIYYHLDMQSLCSISGVCWRLNNIQQSDVVWKTAFYKRFVLGSQRTKMVDFLVFTV